MSEFTLKPAFSYKPAWRHPLPVLVVNVSYRYASSQEQTNRTHQLCLSHLKGGFKMNSSIDQQFIEFVVKSLVGHPDDVSIERTIDEKGVLLELTVNPEDLGRVIGKRGATAQSLRTLLRALGTKNDARYNLKIVDNGEPRPPRDDTPVASGSSDDATTTTDEPVASQETNSNEKPESSLTEEFADEDESVAETSQEETEQNDVISKTRQELADLDDLDV